MSTESLMVKVSNLYNNTGLLAHALHTGIKPSVQHQLSRVWECVLGIYVGDTKRKAWRSLIEPQTVFIDPEAIHAFVKLQSQLSAFITATFLQQDQEPSIAQIKHFIEYICTQYSIDPNKIINQ